MTYKFDFSRQNIFVLVGKQGSGKSYMLRNLLYNFTKQNIFQFGVCFTGTAFNTDYDFLPEDAVHSDYSEERLQQYINKIKEWMKSNKNKKPPPSFLILDDLLGKIKLSSPIFANLISTYRHYNMSVFITSQYMVKNISTLLRELADYAFIFKTKFKNSRIALYESFGQMLDNQDMFNSYLDKATEQQYHCLLYNANTDNKAESYHIYSADSKQKDFKLNFKSIKF